MDDDLYAGLNNEERVYLGLHDAMTEMYEKKDVKCIRLAAIQKANLPWLVQARCHMCLSAKHGPLVVQHAETAVSLLDNEIRELVVPEAFPTEQLELAHEMLQLAKDRESKKAGQAAKASSAQADEASGAAEPSGTAKPSGVAKPRQTNVPAHEQPCPQTTVQESHTVVEEDVDESEE